MSYELINADCLEAMRQMEECSVHSVITDPPYGLGEVKDLSGLLTAWMTDADDRQHTGRSGFMNREWDRICPSPRYWKEVFRVMKPGAHLLCFASTRTWDLMSLSIRLAGFENRDTIRHHQGVPSLAWITGSGFPKGHDVSAAIDRLAGNARQNTGVRRPEQRVAYGEGAGALRCIECGNSRNGTSCSCELPAPTTEEAKKWAGWNTALKPAWECILVFRKPLSESSIARQVLSTGTGALNIDGCRVSHNEPEKTTHRTVGKFAGNTYAKDDYSVNMDGGKLASPAASGRFPANLLLSHHESCQRKGTKRVRGITGGKKPHSHPAPITEHGGFAEKENRAYFDHADPDGMEEVESWECARDADGQFICPVALLDQQSGTSKERPRTLKRNGKRQMDGWGLASESQGVVHGDSGGKSRFFQQFHEIDTGPGFLYQAKSSSSERNDFTKSLPRTKNKRKRYQQDLSKRWCARVRNLHPTVKPLGLCDWLVKLVCPPDGVVLDPFMGSGSIGCSAVRQGFHFIGIDQEAEYVTIAKRRLRHHATEIEKVKAERLFA